MTWNRTAVADALVAVLQPATGGVVHDLPPETLNPNCVVVGRPTTVSYGSFGFGIDDVELPLIIVGGVESEETIDALKATCRAAIFNNQTLNGTVQRAVATGERNWRNYTGAGGIQLLLVELVLQITM